MTPLTRREAILAAGMAGAGTLLGPGVRPASTGEDSGPVVRNGRLKQSVSRWCYNEMELSDLCRAVADMGLHGIDLLREDDWPVVADHGLVCTMASGGGGTIAEGLNDPANHEEIVSGLTKMIPRAARAGVPNVITMVGNRKSGIDDRTAQENCVAALKRVKPVAEGEGVTVCVELLNSKVDHAGYQGDRTAFVVEILEKPSTPRESRRSTTSTTCRSWRETSSAPSATTPPTSGTTTPAACPAATSSTTPRSSNWPAICRAIVDTGFTGYLAHEFVPTGPDPLASLRDAVRRCDVLGVKSR